MEPCLVDHSSDAPERKEPMPWLRKQRFVLPALSSHRQHFWVPRVVVTRFARIEVVVVVALVERVLVEIVLLPRREA